MSRNNHCIDLPVTNISFHFGVEDPLSLPRYLFSSIRGAWGAALKRLSCVATRRKSCIECPLHWDCAYGYLFETPRPEDSERMKLYPFVPHPFAFAPPYPPPYGSNIEIGFTLVGRGIQFFPHVVLAMEAMGRKGLGPRRVPLKLVSIKGSGKELYGGKEILSPEVYSSYSAREARKIEVIFLTPTRMRFLEKEVPPRRLEFHILVRNLLRRISSLSYFHCGRELVLDFRGVIEMAGEIEVEDMELSRVSFKRRSSRTGQTFNLAGFTGRVVFQGELTPFTPFLELGSLVHLGKSTSFGLGKYVWRVLD